MKEDRESDFIELADDQFMRLEPLIKDLTHEIGTPLAVIEGHLDEDFDSPHLEDESVDGKDEIRRFSELAEYVRDHTALYRTLPESYVEALEASVESEVFPERFLDHGEKIASISRDALNYQKRLVNGKNGELATVGELLEPLENCAEKLEAEQDFEYNGVEHDLTGVDSGMRLVFWTFGQNWENYSAPVDGIYEVGFEVDERTENYSVELWNTGEGFFEDYPENREGRELEALQHLIREDYGSHGLSMAYNIAGVYDAEIKYTEEKIDEWRSGFGLRVDLPKDTQSSTSDPS
jgi:signal transduction histidine kinase